MGSFKDNCPPGLKKTYMKFAGRLSDFNSEEKQALNEIFGDVGDIDQVYENGRKFVSPIINDVMNRGLSLDGRLDRIIDLVKQEAHLD